MLESEFQPNPTTPERQDRRTIATFDTRMRLHHKTDGLSVAERDLSCYHNAFKAIVGLMMKRRHFTYETFPRIYTVDTPEGYHAYLAYRDKIFNQGVTWVDHTYPDYTLNELKAQGRDDTVMIIGHAIDEIAQTGSFEDLKFTAVARNAVQKKIKKPMNEEAFNNTLAHALFSYSQLLINEIE